MATNETLDKTLQGAPVTQSAFKRAICEALWDMDGHAGKTDDLIPFLGPEWDTAHGRKIVGKTLINLAAGGTLRRHEEERGVYVVQPRFQRLGVSVYDAMEKSILDSIRSRGGMARWRDIMDDHDLRQYGDELKEVKALAERMQHGTDTPEDMASGVYDVHKTTAFAQMTKVIRDSQNIRQDCLRRGWYNLPIDELNGMTLRGEHAAYLIQATWEEFKKGTKFIFQERDDFFTRVGSVYQEARRAKGMSLLELARRRAVNAALLDLARNTIVKRDVSRHYSEVTAGKRAEMIAAGAAQADVAAYMEDRRNSREGHQFIVDILERFEAGGEGLEPGLEPAGVNIHLNAPTALYEALAKELGIDPVMASRGILMLDFRGPKVVPENNAPNYDRRMDVQEERERRAAGEDDRGTFYGGDDDDVPEGAANEH